MPDRGDRELLDFVLITLLFAIAIMCAVYARPELAYVFGATAIVYGLIALYRRDK